MNHDQHKSESNMLDEFEDDGLDNFRRFFASAIVGSIITFLLVIPLMFPNTQYSLLTTPVEAIAGIFVIPLHEKPMWLVHTLAIIYSILGHACIIYFSKQLWVGIMLWIVWIGISYVVSAFLLIATVGRTLM